jgi:hypothetical protein
MADTVMTMGRSKVTALLRGTANSPDAVNAGTDPAPKPGIMVTVEPRARPAGTTAPDYLFPVEIIPPGGHPQELAKERSGGRPVSWARRVVLEAGRPQVEPRSVAQRATGSGWELDDPFGKRQLPVGPIGPGGAGAIGPGGGGGGSARRYGAAPWPEGENTMAKIQATVINASTDEPLLRRL